MNTLRLTVLAGLTLALSTDQVTNLIELIYIYMENVYSTLAKRIQKDLTNPCESMLYNIAGHQMPSLENWWWWVYGMY